MALIKCRECGNDVSTEAENCPKCGAPVKKPPSVSSKFIGSLAGISIVIGAIILINGKSDPSPKEYQTDSQQTQMNSGAENKNQAPADNPTLQPPVKPIEISALKLFTDYQANEVSADNLYKGKLLAVSGVIQSISKDFMNDPYVVLSGSNQFNGIDAHFTKNQQNKLADLYRGEQITITCIGNGMMIQNPQLDCKESN